MARGGYTNTIEGQAVGFATDRRSRASSRVPWRGRCRPKNVAPNLAARARDEPIRHDVDVTVLNLLLLLSVHLLVKHRRATAIVVRRDMTGVGVCSCCQGAPPALVGCGIECPLHGAHEGPVARRQISGSEDFGKGRKRALFTAATWM